MATVAISPRTPVLAVRPARPMNVGPSKVVTTRRVLTARGRRVVNVLAALLIVLAGYVASGFLTSVSAATTAGAAPATQLLVVQAGDTLWEIASDLDPSADPRELVDQIATLNGLAEDVTLQVGDTLVVPVHG